MKILHVGYSDTLGGASIAMMRLHSSLRNAGIVSKVLVAQKLSTDQDVIGPIKKSEKYFNELKIKIARQKKYIYKHDGKYSHSLNIFSSQILDKIEKIKPDIVNLHWINNELISIKQISQIKIPIVWTFNDMWPMCGGEHYSNNDRYKLGYNKTKKTFSEHGIDLNRYLWCKKKKYWGNNIKLIICISNWLKEKTEESKLFNTYKTEYVPCTINNNLWSPIDKITARKNLNLPLDKNILLFMSTNGIKDFRKGFGYIKDYFQNSTQNKENIMLLNVGKNNSVEINNNRIININETFNGKSDKLKFIYSASDILLTPSILEAFGQVAIEAASCGTPSIGFENTGLSDAIKHKQTGYLAKYLNKNDFDNGINWLLNQLKNNKEYFKDKCLNFVENNFSSNLVSKKYINLYKGVLNADR